MGAIFLFRKGAKPDMSSVRAVFQNKGFSAPAEFIFGAWTLLQYGKILPFQINHTEEGDETSLHACGTLIYKGLGYQDSLQQLLTDFRKGQLDQEQLLGSFCLLFWDGRVISVLMDRSRTLHVFSDETKTCISSSFLAVLAASPKPLPLNRLAVCEKLATGYVVSPDTLIDGILQIDADVSATYQAERDGICFLPVLARPPVELHNKGLGDSIARQVFHLQRHFHAVNALHVESRGELGLSSGYDSRLVLACSQFLSCTMDLHTHATQGIHDAEAGIVQQITAARGLALKQVSTKRIEDNSEDEISALLEDGLYFYDGRCSHNMGAFSETYTRAYKTLTMGEHRLGWNGLGGEMYRNYYFTANRSVNLRHWLDRHVYYPFATEAWGCTEEYEAMHLRKAEKIARRLSAPTSGRVSFQWLRRYYSEVRMPDCDANNNDALNQLAFFHTPFMDASLVAEAINATPFIGCNGTYQARLIREISPDLARFQTHYGYTLDHIPLRSRLQAWVKCRVPEFIQLQRLRAILKNAEHQGVPEFLAFVQRVPALCEIREVLCTSVLRGRFEDAMIHYAQRPTALFVGSFLREFQHKIRW